MTGRYGPGTAQVLALKARFDADRDSIWDRLHPWSVRENLDEAHRLLRLPRDFSWWALHRGVEAHGLEGEFDLLWTELRAGPGGLPPVTVCDAICAQLLVPFLGVGPFTVSNFDVLMAPWRAELDGCARSRLFLEVAARPPFRRDFWPIVDAVLAEAD